jgi:hypothetical protein
MSFFQFANPRGSFANSDFGPNLIQIHHVSGVSLAIHLKLMCTVSADRLQGVAAQCQRLAAAVVLEAAHLRR